MFPIPMTGWGTEGSGKLKIKNAKVFLHRRHAFGNEFAFNLRTNFLAKVPEEGGKQSDEE